MSRAEALLQAALVLLICSSVASPENAQAASTTKAQSNQILLVLDKVNVDRSNNPLAGKAATSSLVEHVDSQEELLERVAQIPCKDRMGVITVEQKKVNDTLSVLLKESLESCPTMMLVEVGIENMDKLKVWGESGFNPFKEEAGTSVPALRIKGSIPTPDGGRGDFTIAAGDSGSWIESWNLHRGEVLLDALKSRVGASENQVAGKGCNAGPFWQLGRLCCFSQLVFCHTLSYLPFIGSFCNNCFGCTLGCLNCVNNPCHSCDPCGLTWLIRRLF